MNFEPNRSKGSTLAGMIVLAILVGCICAILIALTVALVTAILP